MERYRILLDRQIFQQSCMSFELRFQLFVRDADSAFWIGIFEERLSQFIELLVAKLHPILFHAHLQDTLQFAQLNATVACKSTVRS